jgi:hypothetical protein
MIHARGAGASLSRGSIGRVSNHAILLRVLTRLVNSRVKKVVERTLTATVRGSGWMEFRIRLERMSEVRAWE